MRNPSAHSLHQLPRLAVAACVCLLSQATGAQLLPPDVLLEELRSGGLVLVMRHASSPRGAPEAADAAPGNDTLERQLDATGMSTARAMGAALRDLGIPIGEVLSSPTFRALQTARALNLNAEITTHEALGSDSMRADAAAEHSAWLRARAAQAPPARMHTLMVTHRPNVTGAFGDEWNDLADGETLVMRPGDDGARIIGRVAIDAWPALAP